MKRKIVKLSLLLFLGFGTYAFGQTQGRVEDDNGLPEDDVEVRIKGTNTVSYTDENGNFEIDAKIGDTLIINNQEFLVTSTTLGNLKLRSSSNTIDLDELIVVAYGVEKKENVVGSNSVIKQEQIENRVVSNVAKVLEGSSPGVQVSTGSGQPGSGLSVRIRGNSSYNLSNSPLYVVDGAIYTGSISDLNPNDIESINILKDAASTSLYGASAANGVVMITTKKGRKGKGSFNFSAYSGVVSRGIKEYERIGSKEYYVMAWEAMRNGYLTTNPNASLEQANAYASGALIKDNLKNNIYNVDNNLLVVDGIFNPNASLLYNDFDWNKYLNKTGQVNRYDLNYGASTDNSNFFASFGYNNEGGYVIKSDFERYTARASADSQVTDWLKLGVNLSGSKIKSKLAEDSEGSSYINPFFFTRSIGPIYSPFYYDKTGNQMYDDDGNLVYDGVLTRGRGSGAHSGRNVIQETLLNDVLFTAESINSRFFTELKLAKGLTFTSNATYDYRNQNNRKYTNKVIGDASGTGALSNELYKYTGTTINQILNYNTSFDNHNFNILVGHESYEYGYEYQYHRKIMEKVSNNYEFANFVLTTSQTGNSNKVRKESWFSRLNYDFNSKYLVSLSLRNDKSSRFSKDNNSGTFWSAGAGWNIHREDFLSHNSNVSQLKLRSSYGQVGNDGGNGTAPGWQADRNLYSLSYDNAEEPGIYITQQGNPDLTWESNNQFDVALEFGFFQNRISGIVEYFDRRTENMIFRVPTPGSAGVPNNGIFKNIGTMKNSGWEFGLNLGLIKNEEFEWNLSLAATLYDTEMIKMPDDQEEIISNSQRLAKGHSPYDFWLRQWYGVDPTDGAPLYIQDPKIKANAETRTMADGTIVTTNHNNALYDYSGSAIPDVGGYFSTEFKYNGFYLNALFTYQIGGKIYDSNYASLMGSYAEGKAMHIDMLNAWKKPGDITNVPIVSSQNTSAAGAVSSRWLVDADYLALKNAQFGYTFKQDDIKNLGITALKVFVSGENLFSATKRKGLEPAQSFNGHTSYRYTPSRIVALGLNVSF